MKSKLNAALVVMALILGACTSDGTGSDADPTSTTGDPTSTTVATDQSSTTVGGGGLGQGAGSGVPAFVYALQEFDECDALLTWIRSEAAEAVGPYGFNDNYGYFPREGVFATAEDSAGGDDGASLDSFTQSAEVEFSTTNIQELGVDEPDIVKTDGEFLYVLSDNRLHSIDVRDGAVLRDTIEFNDAYPNEILIGPDRLYVLSSWFSPVLFTESGGDRIAPEYEQPTLVITEVLVDNGRLTEQGRLEVGGSYVTARQVGDGARIVVRHDPQLTLPFVYPTSEQAEERAAEVNRQVVLESTLEQWLPGYRLVVGNEESSGFLPDCSRVRTPQEFSGMSTLSVLTLDMAAPITNGNAMSLFGAGDTVYASPSSLYAATFDFPNVIFLEDGTAEQDEDFATAIHQFDITNEAGAEYVASGAVSGHLLNQFAMSEHEGHLRVAVTEGSPWFCCSDETSVSSVHILASQDGELVEVGAVGDLGPDESIFGVRFVGDTGYVVTFRQTDPLYVLDLADPTAPAVAGELKITGYSSYLHPIGDGLVIGVGQEATTDGGTIGTKVSLFDVSDPANPREIDRWVEERSSSSVEYDHKAFLYWAADNLAVIPVDSWGAEIAGAVALEVVDGALIERARIRQVAPLDPSLPTGCDLVDVDVFKETELEWIAFEGGLVVECDPGQRPPSVGGFSCEPIDQYGISDPAVFDEFDEDAAVTICWPEYFDRGEIRRSVVVGDELWTIGYRTVQANDMDTFEVLDRIDL